MSWDSPFIVYRITGEGKLVEVFHAKELKDAKYWLTYIAEAGDVLCKTPAHPRHTEPSPQYFSHKESSGKPISDENAWKNLAKLRAFEGEFPTEQAGIKQ